MLERKKILMLRSAPMELFYKALESLREKFPGGDITVLSQSELKDELSANPTINKVIPINGRRFNFLKNLHLIKRLRREKFDLVNIQYNGVSSISNMSYHNVILFALVCGTGEKMAFNIRNEFSHFNWFTCLATLIIGGAKQIFRKIYLYQVLEFLLIWAMLLISAIIFILVILPYHLIWKKFRKDVLI